MKFSNSLKFNAVSEWWEEYIAYGALKKHVYQLEKRTQDGDTLLPDLESNERTGLLTDGELQHRSATDATFIPLLDHELNKISLFYEMQESQLLDETAELEELVRLKEDEGIAGEDHYDMDGEDDDDEDDDDDDESISHGQTQEAGISPTRRRKQSSSRGKTNRGSGQRRSADISAARRRFSISSSEDNADLEASLADLNASVASRASQSPHRTRKISNLFGLVNPTGSVTSASGIGHGESIWTANTNYAMDTRLLFKRRIRNVYITATSLKSYVELNFSGFRKILKKYDKVTYSELKDAYMHTVVENSLPCRQDSKDRLNNTVVRLVTLYARCVTRGDTTQAARQLKMHQREHIAWERDTVWRQMIGRARRGETDGQAHALGGFVAGEEASAVVAVSTPVGSIKITGKMVSMMVALVVFAILLNVHVVDGREANRCFAILVLATILWATEAIPLFVTSMLIPFLLVVLRVIRSEDGQGALKPQDATKFVFSVMFSPTIMLLIGGFTIASAISKCNIDRLLITRVLSLAGTRPSVVLLTVMGVSCFASMWISNVAAPTLCFTLVRPILRNLPPRSSFGPCLIIAIALAANIGGQTSPISSPQNLIALDEMQPRLDWGRWFAVSIPVSGISIFCIWLFLLVSYRPARSPDGDGEIEIRPIRPLRDPFTFQQYWVSFVCVVTIGLWCVAHEIEEYVGDMGVLAFIPIVAFFSTGVLRKDDFEQFLWTVVFLAMGGISLGKGVSASGLLTQMDYIISNLVADLPLYTLVLALTAVVLVVSTFISHTVASVLLVPIARQVGASIPTSSGGDHANLLVFITGLVCSTGMGMPVSGFPNQTAAIQEDDMGQTYLTNIDFLKNGVPSSIIAAFVVATVGFALMRAIGL